MAKPVCTYCGEYEGVLLVTNLDDGETQVVCGNDLLMWTLSMTGQLTQGMTLDQAMAYGNLLDAIKANDPREPAKVTRSKPRKAEPAPEPPAAVSTTEPAHPGRIDVPVPCDICGATTATGDAEKLTCDGCGTVLATADEAR